MGLTSTVSLVMNGLKVAQDATQIVGANIASSGTDGYTSKTLNVAGIQADTGLVGFRTTVTRAFDQQVYDQLISSTASTSYLSTKSNYASQIDTLMGTTTNGATLSTALASFSSDLQSLASQPSDTAAQISVVNSATALTQSLNSMSKQVDALTTAVNGDIDEAVKAVNDLTTQISKLNTQVVSYKSQGLDSSGLEDARDNAILKLSTYMDVQVKTSDDGSVRVSTGEALTLVDNARATQFERDANGKLVVANDGTGTTDVLGLGLVTSGSLSALYEARDKTLPQVRNQLDQVAATLASAMSDTTTAGTAVTSGAQSGYSVDLASLQAGNKVTLTYKDNATNATKTVTFVKVSSASALPLPNGATADPNDTVVGIDFSGGSASVATQIQSALGSSFSVSNPSGTTLQILDDGAAGTVDVSSLTTTATTTTVQSGSAKLPLFTDGTGVYTGSFDNGSQLDGLASRITINAAVTAQPSLLVKYSTTTQASDTTRPYALFDSLNKGTSWYTLGGTTTAVNKSLSGYTDAMVSYWGSQSTNAATDLSNQQVVQSNLKSSMSSISSVNTDTELAKLIQLQSTYAANAHVLSTVKEMLSTLLSSV